MAAITLSSAGQAFLKLGALKLGPVEAGNAIAKILTILRTPELIIGLSLYGFSSIAFILVLTRVKLSVAAPAISMTYIISVLMGYFIFKESITIQHLIGFTLIICGVILVIRQ